VLSSSLLLLLLLLLLLGMAEIKTDQMAGINQAVHPPKGELDGNAIFAIVCVYLFVVFYSFGWGPTPFILSSECAPNHVRSLIMAAALMTQWLFNFVIAVSELYPFSVSSLTICRNSRRSC
jgi:SP family sugar:H+ symporter-like MFS transporter